MFFCCSSRIPENEAYSRDINHPRPHHQNSQLFVSEPQPSHLALGSLPCSRCLGSILEVPKSTTTLAFQTVSDKRNRKRRREKGKPPTPTNNRFQYQTQEQRNRPHVPVSTLPHHARYPESYTRLICPCIPTYSPRKILRQDKCASVALTRPAGSSPNTLLTTLEKWLVPEAVLPVAATPSRARAARPASVGIFDVMKTSLNGT